MSDHLHDLRQPTHSNAPDTRNSINSISKTFTAAAVMKLLEQGRLFMDEELLAKGRDGTLGLTYTDELVIRPVGGPDGRRLQLEIGGKTLVGVHTR